LRIDARDVSRRGELERRKLREMIDFCYTDRCYRAHILNYFGDRNHARQCGTCGNCRPEAPEPVHPGEDRVADVSTFIEPSSRACAKRMNGRFGKKMLVLTLRGSAAKQVLTAHLNELSTYGLLKEMAADELELYIDALTVARCLRVKPGAYPTISTTELGDRVMREQERVNLALPN
jgi:ATP-dependent DNA helicase RecQ